MAPRRYPRAEFTPELVPRHPLISFYVLTYAVAWFLSAPLSFSATASPARWDSCCPAGIPCSVHAGPGVHWPSPGKDSACEGCSGPGSCADRAPLVPGSAGPGHARPTRVGVSILMVGIPGRQQHHLRRPVLVRVYDFSGSALGEEIGCGVSSYHIIQAPHSALKASLLIGILWAPWHLPLWLTGSEGHPISLYVPFVVAVVASSVFYTWLYNNTGGSLLIVVLYHAASNLPITVLISPLGSQMAQPFLIYVALTVVAAAIVVIVTGAENLSRTAPRQIEQP